MQDMIRLYIEPNLFFFFFLLGLKFDVKKFIREYDTCQRVKAENVSPTGLL
jgi:hypothetical protein